MWTLFSVLSAVASAIRSALGKSVANKNNEYVANWAIWFWALPLLFVTLLFLGLPQSVTPLFWEVLIANILLNVVASFLFIRALKLAPLSLVTPIISLTPVLVTVASLIILHEMPSTLGLVGILLAVIGTYLLNISQLRLGIFGPIKELFRNPGSRYALLLVPVWGITSTLDKIAITNSSPIFYLICISAGVSMIFMIFIKHEGIANFGLSSITWPGFLSLGTAYGAMLIFQMFAIQSAYVAYALSIKRVDALFGIALGYFFFKETSIKERLVGAVLILLSIVCIALA